MLEALRPGHLGDVHETFDTRLDFDECAVVCKADDFAMYTRALRVTLGHRLPGVGHQLLVAQADAFLIAVELQHFDLNRIADFENVARRLDAAPAHIDDVQQSVNAAEINERAVVCDVFDDAFHDDAFFDVRQCIALLVRGLFFKHRLARDDDVAAFAVKLDDAHLDILIHEGFEVAYRADIDLRAGQERGDAFEVNLEAAFDAFSDPTGDRLMILVGAAQLLPGLHLHGSGAREDGIAVLVFEALDEHVDFIAGLDGQVAAAVNKLLARHDAFGFVADVNHHVFVGDADDRATNDLAFLLGSRLLALVVFKQGAEVTAAGFRITGLIGGWLGRLLGGLIGGRRRGAGGWRRIVLSRRVCLRRSARLGGCAVWAGALRKRSGLFFGAIGHRARTGLVCVLCRH